MIENETISEIVRLIGQYLIENADHLAPIEYSDLTEDEFFIRMKRRDKPEDANER